MSGVICAACSAIASASLEGGGCSAIPVLRTGVRLGFEPDLRRQGRNAAWNVRNILDWNSLPVQMPRGLAVLWTRLSCRILNRWCSDEGQPRTIWASKSLAVSASGTTPRWRQVYLRVAAVVVDGIARVGSLHSRRSVTQVLPAHDIGDAGRREHTGPLGTQSLTKSYVR